GDRADPGTVPSRTRHGEPRYPTPRGPTPAERREPHTPGARPPRLHCPHQRPRPTGPYRSGHRRYHAHGSRTATPRPHAERPSAAPLHGGGVPHARPAVPVIAR